MVEVVAERNSYVLPSDSVINNDVINELISIGILSESNDITKLKIVTKDLYQRLINCVIFYLDHKEAFGGLLDKLSNSKRRDLQIAEQNNIELRIDKKESNNYCIDCGKKIRSSVTRCGKCNREFVKQRGIERLPVSRDELKNMIRNTSFVQIGKYFNISDNAIRKWCKKLNLPYSSNEIKKYSDIEWESI